MKQLVNWPKPETPWKDSGEGGMFAYAFWSEDDGDKCCVEHNLRLMQYDVITCADGPLESVLFPDPNADDAFWKLESEARSAWEKKYPNGPYWYESGNSLKYTMYDHIPTAAMYLGSTSHALYNHDEGRYFGVSLATMTPMGANVLKALEAAYGAPATILTMLDT